MQNCLILEDQEKRLLALMPALESSGWKPVFPNGDAEHICAREAEKGLALLGVEEGALRALSLAERYPVGKLALIGCPLRPRGKLALRRRVEYNLFSIVSDTLVVQPKADSTMRPRSVNILLRGVNAHVERLDMGKDFDDLWINCKQQLSEAVLCFLNN